MLKILANQIIISFLILLSFVALYTIKRQIFPGEIVFFEAIISSIFYITALSIFVSYVLDARLKKFFMESILASFLMITLFNSLIPTILDRSVSITILGTLKKSTYPLSELQINESFNQIYVIQEDAVGVRLKEQLATGNIKIDENGNYSLTNRGVLITNILSKTTKILNVNSSFIDQREDRQK
jgi:hypothetical protein